MVQEYLENAGGAVSIEDNMGNGTVVTVSLDPKRVQEIERASGRGAAVRPETEQPTYPLPGAFAQQPWQRSRCSPPWGRCSSRNASYTRAPGGIDVDAAKHARGHARWRIRMQQQCSRRRGHRVANKWAISRTIRDIHISRCRHWGMASSSRSSTSRDISSRTSRCRSSQYNPWAQQMPPQPYQQWPQSFQQQMPTMQSSQQPAAQMMYPNAANQYAQPQPDVFVSDRGNAALGYLAQNQACGATDLARAFGNSAPTWSRTLNDLAQAGLVIKHGQKYHLTELGAARVRAQS